MEIRYKNKRIRDICENEKKAIKKQYFCIRRFYPLDFFLILDNNVSINSFI